MNNEIYFSTDVETDGPIPGPHSMMSLGSAAFLPSGRLVGTFSVNLAPLAGASPDPDTLEWWKSHPEAYQAATHSPEEAGRAMEIFSGWVNEMSSLAASALGQPQSLRPVFVGFPAGFDFLFVYWYLIKFTGKSPFSFSALDGKTLAMALLQKPYRKSTKRNYPKEWFPKDSPHTHVAVQDAIEQGKIFCKMLNQVGID